jgi:hypothetical protein
LATIVQTADMCPLLSRRSIYFDLATLCEQAELPLNEVRAGAKARAEALRWDALAEERSGPPAAPARVEKMA